MISELRDLAVRMVLDIRGEADRDEPGVIPWFAKQLGIGTGTVARLGPPR